MRTLQEIASCCTTQDETLPRHNVIKDIIDDGRVHVVVLEIGAI